MGIEHWMGTSYHIHCEILDAKGQEIVRAKPWAPPAQDVEWVNPCNKQTLPPMGPVGRAHMYNEELIKPGEPLPTPTSYHQVSPPTQCTLLPSRVWGYIIGDWLHSMLVTSMEALSTYLSMASFMGNPLRVKMRSNMTNGFLR